jgi:N-acetylmuramoyl-L-alanine amidase
MRYIAKKQKNTYLKWKILIPLFMLVISGLYFYNQYQEKQELALVDTYGICGLNNIDTRKKVNNYSGVYQIKDYFFYGETLNIYSNNYEMNMDDNLIGKTVSLINMCTDQELVYMIEKKVDGQIPLEDLENGVYELFLNQSLDQKRIVYPSELNQIFYTVSRNGSNKKITIKTDKQMFDDYASEQYLNDYYIYIIVEDADQPEEYYDIIIDPSNNTKDGGYVVEYGYQANGLIEAEENLKVAEYLQADLESMGLKVLLTRTGTEVVDSYGVDGRLYKGYNANCRYYIEIGQKAASNSNYRGTKIYYSAHASNKLGSIISKQLINNTSLLMVGSANNGVEATGLYDGYDGMKMIRESGGIALNAGTFSEQSELNASFNKDNIFGMHTITIEYIYLTNVEDVEVWNNEIENIAKETANGIAKYLGIEGQ